MNDDHKVIDAEARSWLRDLARFPLVWGTRRPVPKPVLDLITQGLAFRDARGVFTITDAGRDVAERTT